MPKGPPAGHNSERASAERTPDLPTTVIEEQPQIDRLCRLARSEGCFAFDTEFVMEDRYEPEVCLVQVATVGEIFLIDPFLKLDLQPIWELVATEEVEIVVHVG